MSISPSTETDAPKSPAAIAAEPSKHASPPAPPASSHGRRTLVWIVVILAVIVVLALAIPWVIRSLNTVSTDDAYVNGHVTFVAARVGGQVSRVLVDDNNRVHKGDLLVQLDKEPYQIQVNIAQAAVDAAEATLVSAKAQGRGIEGQMRSLRFALENAIEDVDNKTELLKSKVSTLNSFQASLSKAQSDYDRAVPLAKSGAVSAEELDHRKQDLLVAQAQADEALQNVYQVRVALGLPPKPLTGDDLASVPADLDQTFSGVRQAQYSLLEAAAQVGVTDSFNTTPKQMVENFYKRDPSGNVDIIYANLLKNAPAVKQAETKLAQAERDLDQAKLNLRYCDVVAEIDGVITRRDVNPGNNIIPGQSLMAIRSLTDIWIDANFKETQLRDLRIGQPADLDVDMYGSRMTFKGRISGFTMGTGSTLALLPAENATGNFVKVVQRLPVRIDLIDYDPDKAPLFIGVSVEPTVHIDQPATGADAGKLLQPFLQEAVDSSAGASTMPSAVQSPGSGVLPTDAASPVPNSTPGGTPGIQP